jgi:hypothetical protein
MIDSRGGGILVRNVIGRLTDENHIVGLRALKSYLRGQDLTFLLEFRKTIENCKINAKKTFTNVNSIAQV